MNFRHSLTVSILSLFLLAGLNSSIAAAAASKDTEKKAAASARIDLNSATAEQLKELPGVGDATAAKIIANRPYSSAKDLSKAGLTANQIEKISPQVVAKKPAAAAAKPRASGRAATAAKPAAKKRIDLNTASAAELQTLPGVGPVGAQKIIDHRPYASAADLRKAGLPADTMKKVTPMVSASKAPAARRNAPQPTSTAKKPSSSPAQKPESSSAKPVAPSSPEAKAPPAASDAETQAAAKSGKVWLNTESNIYHRSGDRFFGTTRSGKFVTEEEAIRAGARESGK